MKDLIPWNIAADIMAAERNWTVPINSQPSESKTVEPQPETGMSPNANANEKKSKGQAAFWANMTPEQRSAEIARRHAVARANRESGGDGKTVARVAKALSDTTAPTKLTAAAKSFLEAWKVELQLDLEAVNRLLTRC